MLSAPLPFVDLRGKTPVDLLRAYPDRARDLVKANRRIWGAFSDAVSMVALPVGDRISHRWLKKQHNPYLHEIETFADIMNTPGIYALNVAFEWGCTTGVWTTGEHMTLLRTLDWPFPGLGKYVLIALQEGKAGAFYNITWPGVSGVFTAMAPGRFAVAINQAPIPKHNLTFAGDWLRARITAYKEEALPPAHMLRQVCETAANYDEAKERLMTTPIAAPAMFTLSGVKYGQGCVIERLEHRAEVRPLDAGGQVSTTNHFNSDLHALGHGWWPREIDSAGRYRQSQSIAAHELEQPHFNWLSSPMINAYTRLAVLADAANEKLMVQGFEGPVKVTPLFTLLPTPYAEQKAS